MRWFWWLLCKLNIHDVEHGTAVVLETGRVRVTEFCQHCAFDRTVTIPAWDGRLTKEEKELAQLIVDEALNKKAAR